MLNLEEYISSGIVEKYVMGLTDETETLEFEQLLSLYPQLRTAMNLYEINLEKVFAGSAVPPPARVWNYLQTKIGAEQFRNGHQQDYKNSRNNKGAEDIYSVNSTNQIRVHKNFRYAFIALVVLSKVFLYAAISYYLMYKDEMKQRIRLEQQVHQMSPSSGSRPQGSVPY